jgi:hypothetical protein
VYAMAKERLNRRSCTPSWLPRWEKGLLHFKGNCWKKDDYYASIKQETPIDKLSMPAEGIRIKIRLRRTLIKEEPESEFKPKYNNKEHRKAKGMMFVI